MPCPTPGWAELVHPDLEPAEALRDALGQIVTICRLDADDPVAAWEVRMTQLARACAALNERRFDALHLEGPGTDLRIGLLPGSSWNGGGLTTSWGLQHQPNLPTEEVFTTPDPERVDGVVRATKPRELDGTIVRDFEVRFEGGRVASIQAGANGEVLEAYADRDEGAGRLGEIALVDGERPHRPARHGLLRHADRRERRQPHGARPGVRLGGRRGRSRPHQPQRDPRRLHGRVTRGRRHRRHRPRASACRCCAPAPGRSSQASAG